MCTLHHIHHHLLGQVIAADLQHKF